MLKNRGMLKSVVIVLSMTLFFTLFPFSFKVTFATDDNQQIDSEEIIHIANVIEHGLKRDGSDYTLNVNYAEKQELTSFEIKNLRDYLDKTRTSEVKEAINEADNLKEEVKENENNGLISLSSLENSAYAAGPNIWKSSKVILKIIIYSVVGATIASKFVEDMYDLGVYSACHKWGKHHSSIKKACKATGHW